MQELAWFSTGDHSVFVWYHLFNDRTGEEIRTSQYGESCYTEIENMFRDRPRNCSIIFRHAPYLSMHHFLACLKTKTPILSWHPCDIISIRVLHYENTYCVLTASEVATMCDLHYEHTNYILTAFRLTTFCGLQMRKKLADHLMQERYDELIVQMAIIGLNSQSSGKYLLKECNPAWTLSVCLCLEHKKGAHTRDTMTDRRKTQRV